MTEVRSARGMQHAASAVGERASPSRSGLRVWPLRKPAWWVLLKGTALVVALWSGFGLLLVHVFEDGPIGSADRRVSIWFAEHRTPTVNSLTNWGSMLAESLVKWALVLIVGSLVVLLWRRWHDALFLATVVAFEGMVFVIVSFIVDRQRPPVEQLDPIPPSGSFPSGHTTAAVAFYGALLVVVWWHTKRRAVRAVFALLASVIPVIVGISRVARGMHHLIDVVAGLALGIASVLVVRAALQAGVAEVDRRADAATPEHTRRLDLTAPGQTRRPIARMPSGGDQAP
ncbi:MAG: hypothetical protein QOJ19_421 [Acidimicrobiia bacterium]|nr:hypothetical protein [Acidimicrobiia bacterium]